MHMEITAHGFVMRRALRADIAREIGRFVQAVQQPIKKVSVDLYKERQRTMRVVNKYCRVHVEFLNDVQALWSWRSIGVSVTRRARRGRSLSRRAMDSLGMEHGRSAGQPAYDRLANPLARQRYRHAGCGVAKQ